MHAPLNPEQKSWLNLMDKSAHALLDLLNDVLDLSRIEAGKLPMGETAADAGPQSTPMELSEVAILPACACWWPKTTRSTSC